MLILAQKDDHVTLKQFALTMAWAFPLFFAGILPWIFGFNHHWWPFVISAFFLALYAIAPGLIYYPYLVWMRIAGVLGWINTRLLLGVTFYCVMWPIALVLRMLGSLQYRSRPKQCESYYVKRDEKIEKDRFERPF